jgi:peptidoglycan hydrolase FlgJ
VAIKPPSDLVLDVAAAAQPDRVQAAAARLENASAGESATEFARNLDAVAKAAAAAKSAVPAALVAPQTLTLQAAMAAQPVSAPQAAPPVTAAQTDASRLKAMQKMEAFFLQTVVQEILPKDAENVYGSGLAGDVWKSMLAEHVAAEIAKSSKFGIAEQLAGKHFVQHSPAATSSAATPHPDNTGAAAKSPLFDSHRSHVALGTGSGATSIAAVKRS